MKALLRIALAMCAAMILPGCGRQTTLEVGQGPYRVGFLSASSSPSFVDALKDGLTKQGLVEGKNLELDSKITTNEAELANLAKELAAAKVDLIIAGGTKAVEAAKEATSEIPIVMTNSGDAVKTGLVVSLQKPGGNITGLTQISPLLAPKRLELIKEAFPASNKVAVIWNPDHPTTQLSHQELVGASPGLGIELISLPTKDASEIGPAFASAASKGAGSAIVLRDPFMVKNQDTLVAAADSNKLPAIYETINFVEAGGLMLYGPSFEDLYRRSATYVSKILKGADPAELPVEQPRRFELIINMRTAKASGFDIADSVLRRADRLIE
ncbi:MAG: ABC transporter substrate-binding protein [Actinomycetota bacterium]